MTDAFQQALAGLIGGCFATTVTYPIEIVRTRIQTGAVQGLLEGFIFIYKKKGFRGYFDGLSSQYIQTALTNFLFYYFNSSFKTRWRKYKSQALIKVFINLHTTFQI